MDERGCVHYFHEHGSYDYPETAGCMKDHCTNGSGGFTSEGPCPDCSTDHGCDPDCPGFREAA
jgi:hypothetical protein